MNVPLTVARCPRCGGPLLVRVWAWRTCTGIPEETEVRCMAGCSVAGYWDHTLAVVRAWARDGIRVKGGREVAL